MDGLFTAVIPSSLFECMGMGPSPRNAPYQRNDGQMMGTKTKRARRRVMTVHLAEKVGFEPTVRF
jgi:hypothetical protein